MLDIPCLRCGGKGLDPRHRSRGASTHLRILYHRRDHLRKRVEESDKDLTYDKQEVAALDWVLKQIESKEEVF